MATDSGGDELTQAVITCEGDIKDPHFPVKFHHLVKRLKKVIFHEKEENRQVNVHRVEPWNSVRVTFTLPREAAVRLRQLAQAGDATLRELGILSVQLEGDQVISLTIAGRYEAQEIVFRTESSANSTSNGSNIGINSISGGGASGSSTVGLPAGGPVSNSVSELLTHVTSGTTVNGVVAPSVGVSVLQAGQGEESSGAMVPQPGAVTAVAASVSAAISATSGTGPFRSPNVVAPVSSQPIPYIAAQSGRAPMSPMAHTYGGTSASGPFAARPQSAYVGPYPFASMTHAAHAMLGQNNLPLARTRPPVPSVSTMVSASPTNPTSPALFPASTSTASVTGPVTSAPMISTSVSGAGPPHPNLPSALHLPPSKTVAASVDSTAPSPSSLLPMQPGINHLQSAHNFTHTSSVTHTPSVVSSPTPSSSPLPLSSSTAFLTGPTLSASSVVAPVSTPPAAPLVTNHPSVGLPGQPASLASGLASSSLSSTVGNTVNPALTSHAQAVGGTSVPTNPNAVAAASRPVVSQVMVGASGSLMSGGSVTGSGLSLTQTPPTTVSSPLLVNLLQQQQQQQQIARATMATVNTQMSAPPGSNLATTTTVTNTSALANVVVAGAATIPVSNAGVPLRPDSAPATDGRLPSRVAGGRSMSLNSPASLSPSVSPYHTSPNSPVVPATGSTTAMTSVGTPVATSETNLTLAASVTVLNVRTGAPLNAALSSLAPPTPLPPAAPTSDQSIVEATSVDASTRLTPSSINNQQPPGRQGAGVTAVSVAGSALPAAGVGIQTASTANAAVTVNAPVVGSVRPIVGVGIRPSPQQVQAFRHPSQNVSLANRLPNPPPYPGTGLRPSAHMVHNSRLPVIPGGATVTAVPATIAASISASSNPSSSSVSANLLDGMVCVNDTYMLPGRNNLSITVVTDPQRTAAINRGVTAASPVVPVVASGSTPAIPATSTATSPSNAITISRTASEMEHKKQLLINPLTGHLEPSPSESSDSDVEVTKDLENSILMQSLLDNTSPNFFDRPLSDSLFSDEDTDKNNSGPPAAPPASIETEAAVVKAAGAAAKEKETGEGIKLRLKLEKSEPTAVNYVAFVNVPSKPSSSASISSASSSDPATPVSGSSSANSPAEPRVPPLHISLKGRNLTVLSPKKETKKKKVRSRHDSGDEDEDFHRGDKKLVKRKRVAVLPNYSEDYDEPVLPVQLPQPVSPPLPLPNHTGSASNNVATNNSSLGGDSVGESIQVTFKPKVKTKADESVEQDIGNSAECNPLESQSNVQPPAVISPARLNSVDDDGTSTQTATVEESVNSGSVVNRSPFVTTSERTCTDSTSSSTVVPALVIPTTPAITATLAPSSALLLSSLSTVSVTSTDDSAVSNATSATETSSSTLDAPPSSASVVEEKKIVMVGASVEATTVTNLSPAFAGETKNVVDQATSNPVPDISAVEDVSEIAENCRPVELEETEIVVPQRSADAEPVSCPTPERDPLALNKPNEVTVVNNISHLKCQVEETLNDAKREEVALDFYQESVGTDGLSSHLSMKDEVVKGLRPKAGNLSEDLHKLSVLNNVHKNALSRDAKHLHVNPVSVEVRSATVHHDHQGHHEHQLVARLVDQAKDSNQLTLETLKAPKADLVPAEGRGTEDGGNTQGEDSGIESLDALSEKSPNQSESPPRREDKDFASTEQTPQTQPSRPPPPPPPSAVTSQSSEAGKSSTCESPARAESPAPTLEPAPMSTPTLVPAPTEATPPPVVVPNAPVPSTLLSDNTVESLSTKPSSSDLLPPPQTSTVEESVATITEDHGEAEEGTKANVEVPVSKEEEQEHMVTSGASNEPCASPIDRQPEEEKLLPDEEVNMAEEVAVVDIQVDVTVEKANEVGSPLISKESDAPTDADETEQLLPPTDPSDVVTDVSKDVDDLSKGATDLSTIETDPSELSTELSVVATNLPEVATDLPEVATDVSEIMTDPLSLTDMSDAADELPEIKTDHPEVIYNPLVDLTDNLDRNEDMEHSTSIVESSEEVKGVEEPVEKIQDATVETSINEDSVVEEQALKTVEAVAVEPLELEERVEPSEGFENNEAVTEVTEVDEVAETIEQVDEPNTDPIETVEDAVPNLIPVVEESVPPLVSVDDATVSIEKPSSPTPPTVPSATIQNGPVPSPSPPSLSDQQPLSTPSDAVNSPVTVVAPSSPQQNEVATSLSPESIGNSPSSTPDPASPVAEESMADSSAQPASETLTTDESANPGLEETVSITASEASPLTESVGNCTGLSNDNETAENAFNDRVPESPSPPSASAATSSNNVILTTVRDNSAMSKPATPTQVVIVSSTSAGSSSSLVNSTGLFAMTSGSKMVPIRLVTLPKGLDLATTASMSQGSPVKILVSKMSPGKLQGTPVSAVVMKSVIMSTASALVNQTTTSSQNATAPSVSSASSETIEAQQEKRIPLTDMKEEDVKVEKMEPIDNVKVERDDEVVDDESEPRFHPQSPFHGFPSQNATPEDPDIDGEVDPDDEAQSDRSNNSYSSPLYEPIPSLDPKNDLEGAVSEDGGANSPNPPALQPVVGSLDENRITDALTIEIPNAPEMVTRCTRSGTRIISPDIRRSPRQQSPLLAPNNSVSNAGEEKTVPARKSTRRKRQESGSSGTSDPPSRDGVVGATDSGRQSPSDALDSLALSQRPSKRKCSENASELIKACMGLDDTPRKNVAPGENANSTTGATSATTGLLGSVKKQRCGSMEETAVLKRNDVSDDDSLGDLPTKVPRQNRSNSRNRNSKRNVAKTKEAGSAVNLLQQPVSTTPPPSSTRRSVRHAAGATTGLSVAGATAAALGVNVVGKATTPSIENNGAAFKATARRKTRSSAALADPENDNDQTMATAATGQATPPSLQQPATTPTGTGPTSSDAVSTTSVTGPCSTPLTTSNNKRRRVSRDSR